MSSGPLIARNQLAFDLADLGRGTMIEAGSETTSMFLNNAIVGFLSNPDVVEKCHEELDRVIGSDRTPTMEDVNDLPWTRSVVKVRNANIPRHVLMSRRYSDGDPQTSWGQITMLLKMTGMKDTLSQRVRSSC
jgi:hypothetical protein